MKRRTTHRHIRSYDFFPLFSFDISQLEEHEELSGRRVCGFHPPKKTVQGMRCAREPLLLETQASGTCDTEEAATSQESQAGRTGDTEEAATSEESQAGRTGDTEEAATSQAGRVQARETKEAAC